MAHIQSISLRCPLMRQALYRVGKASFCGELMLSEPLADAAAYADDYALWEGVGSFKAKVAVVNGPVGVLALNGSLTDYVNIYRTRRSSVEGRLTRFVHGSPGSPP